MSSQPSHPAKEPLWQRAIRHMVNCRCHSDRNLAFPSGSRASVTNQFIRLSTYPSGGVPARTVSADFNRDGKEDVVVLNSNGVLSTLFESGN